MGPVFTPYPSLPIRDSNADIFTSKDGPQNFDAISDADWEISAERVDTLSPNKRKYKEDVNAFKLFLAQPSSPKVVEKLENDQIVKEPGRTLLETDTLPVLFEGLPNPEKRLGDDDLASLENSSSNPSNQPLVLEAALKTSNTEEKTKEESKIGANQHIIIEAPKRKRRRKDELDDIYSVAFDLFYAANGRKGQQTLIATKYNLCGNNCFAKYKCALRKCLQEKEPLSKKKIREICKSVKVKYERVMDLLPGAEKHKELFYY
ncbi:MAG TPA: hypothetical protein VLG76_07080 [Rhabdochlamydiaceae bacterium]|nr:hypothetical protein [Rhabdochlamydiaceae bacterium]